MTAVPGAGGSDPRPGHPPAEDGTEPGPDADPEAVAREIVLRLLTVRARSRSELQTALAKRRVPPDVAERVLERMGEVGLVDDAAFAESWVSSRQQRRHLSTRALRHELQRKGIDRDQVDEALAGVEPEDEHAAALALAEKKLRSMSGLEPHVRRRRLAGALARKGFGSSLVMQVLDEVELSDDEG
ncbi:recombination regulator RecX [Auraticoccus sp. F435]|uniref:Regulatory protein RecX n=1 Tax=Auraticoccus cholistanensis TaxID=2656650 RepID=A0A6A9USI9_9ACTN|nr:regulatory protein RecX [Auraticoccus cholistanensis]MVA75661.1 recombination regulator RecX [Auraticoccus cholistanensis]